MKPLFDLLLKSKFIPLSCRTKSVMYLTETIPHTSNLTAEQSCQHKKKKTNHNPTPPNQQQQQKSQAKTIKNSTPNSMGLVTEVV